MAIIGITPCNRLPDYVESIRRAGGEPRVLSTDAAPSVQGLDGVLFTGGDDLDPAHYREARHPRTKGVDAVRDEFELALARLALAEDTPVLAVCRGLQVINVAAGGTLIQDIASEVTLGHQIDAPLYAIAHEVWVARGSALSNVMQEQLADGEVLQVNSRHHQAVKQTAPGFDVCATAPDGIIEAIERPNSRFCIAVQWHPENFWRTGEFRALFEGFVNASEKSPST
jgi:putative glutamine amidotransferase